MAARSFANPVPGNIGPEGGPGGSAGFYVTQGFADEATAYGPHDGLDLANGKSGADVLAMDDGTVYQAFFDSASGGAGIIRIDYGGGWTGGYAHMDQLFVAYGARVSRGQRIARLDNTGWSSGAHLHMDTTYYNARQDPWPLLAQNQGEWPAMKWRPVQEEWNTKTGNPAGRFYTEGPGVGEPKYFTASERVTSVAEADGPEGDAFRQIRYGDEILFMQRSGLNPISGTRDPASGYGPPTQAGGFYVGQHLRGHQHIEITKATYPHIEGRFHWQADE